jgi:hypothetical protein
MDSFKLKYPQYREYYSSSENLFRTLDIDEEFFLIAIQYTCKTIGDGDERTPDDNVSGFQKELSNLKMKRFSTTNTKVAVDFVTMLVSIADNREKNLSREQLTSTLKIIIKECITQKFTMDKKDEYAMAELGNFLQSKVQTILTLQDFCSLLMEKVLEIAAINKQAALYSSSEHPEPPSTKDYNNSSRKDGNANSTKDYNNSSRRDGNANSSKDNRKDVSKSEGKRKRSPSRERQ